VVFVKSEWDVVVAGGGPAGLFFAIKAAEGGLDVLVLDKKQEIGSPVRCAEGLGVDGVNMLLNAGLPDSDGWKGWPVKGAYLYAPNGRSVRIPGNGYVVERPIMEREMAKAATRKGARVLAAHDVCDVIKEGGRVAGVRARFLGEEREFRAPLVIAADGFESLLARKAGLNTFQPAYHVDSGFEYLMSGLDIDADAIHLFFGRDVAPRGYVWIFPKGNDTANVGIGIDARLDATAKQYLDRWIEKHGKDYGLSNASVLEVRGGGIPVGGFLKKMTADGLIVVGDAAHQVHPLHGGGMFLAMEAAEIAADVALKAFERGDFTDSTLSEYNDRWWKLRGRSLETALKLRYAFERLDDEDFNYLVDVLSSKDVLAMAEGDAGAVRSIALRVLKDRPRLAWKFREFIGDVVMGSGG